MDDPGKHNLNTPRIQTGNFWDEALSLSGPGNVFMIRNKRVEQELLSASILCGVSLPPLPIMPCSLPLLPPLFIVLHSGVLLVNG